MHVGWRVCPELAEALKKVNSTTVREILCYGLRLPMEYAKLPGPGKPKGPPKDRPLGFRLNFDEDGMPW